MALDFIGGCLGGSAGVIVGHPFDTVKVRLQIQGASNAKYKGTFHCFSLIIKKESVFGLYKGMASPLAGLTFINAIVFGVQGNMLRRFEHPTIASNFIAGAVAGGLQCIICCPMELAKTRMQIQGQGESRRYFQSTQHDYKGSIDCIKKIYHQEGIKGCYRGMVPTLLREIPSFGVYFAAYEFFCSNFEKRSTTEHLGLVQLLLAGGFSGMCSWMSTYPVDVIKSRLQADGMHHINKYNGIIDCIVKSYKEPGSGGIKVFFRGLNSTLLRAFPVNAATFTVVTLFLRYARPKSSQPSGESLLL
ncbi:mitochondrial basic amino acids transporter-like [Saccoglossus kowalevskii]|uniref:Mitochondrial carnitine/acylcarnitine carrier protein CACL-like n=1 Tax=Saccoglossus kowalevskii TaxID=10224 RepID=A0ABM0GLK9_SACKO|nr:PREDICTED: mitochondrial carnitine/acylcarnitine carrier protein CACL-like [Saccoglossus kowalevskii]